MTDLLEPQDIKIEHNGKEKTYIISKFPAIQGREIIAKYPVSNMPKIGDYAISEEVMLKLMCFVAVRLGETIDKPGIIQRLDNKLLVDNHVPSWEVLARIEIAMMEYNCSFFQKGRISNFLNDFVLKYLPKTLETLMASLAQLSQTEKPH
jgi:hypothetical protein